MGSLLLVKLPAVIGFTPQRSVPNIDVPQRPSPIAIFVMFVPNGGSPWEGNRDPKRLSAT